MKTFAKLLVVGGVAAAMLVASGVLQVQLRWLDNDAHALDLFGSSDDAETDAASAGQPFWQEGSGKEPIIPRGVPNTFADLAESTSPGVVNISAEKTIVGHPLEGFFGMPNFPFQVPEQGLPRERKQMVPSLGTGFVISPDGYIVTNNHVIEDVEKITVKFNDTHELPAVVVGRDPKTDIALIKVEAKQPLFALPLGSSEGVRPGEWVVAIGINTAINPRASSIGFAVPIDMAKAILPQLRASGHVTRGWLGVVIQGVSPEIAEELELEETKGALVSKVIEDGPAAEAGIEKMDVIREFDGHPVEDYNDLPRIVASTPVNKKVEIVVVRNGKRVTLRPQIAVLSEPELQKASVTPPQQSGADAFGLSVQDLTDDLAEKLGLQETQGVVVSSVDPQGPASEAGIRRGDVIIEVDRQEVNDSASLRKVLEKTDDRALMLIRRGENQLYMTVKRAG